MEKGLLKNSRKRISFLLKSSTQRNAKKGKKDYSTYYALSFFNLYL